MGKGGQLAIAVLSVLVAMGWVLSSAEGTFQFFDSVEKMLAVREQLAADRERDLRVHGFVVNGSIRRDLAAEQVWFSIGDTREQAEASPVEPAVSSETEEPRLVVVYNGIDVPDLFQDGAEVVVEGRMGPDTFTATKIMAKCPSKYENAPEGPPAQIADVGLDD